MSVTHGLYAYVLIPAALVACVLLALWILYRLARSRLRLPMKVGLTLLLCTAFLTILFFDVILGRIEFSRLCNSQSMVKVSRVVELGNEDLDADGYLKTQLLGDRSGYIVANRYLVAFSEEDVFTSPRITKQRVEIRDTQMGNILGEYIDFQYWGGWLIHRMPVHVNAIRCKPSSNRVSLTRLVFKTP